MSQPPLNSLHLDSSLSQPKLAQSRRLTTEELIVSVRPGLGEGIRIRAIGLRGRGQR